jgi:hypothetical protein
MHTYERNFVSRICSQCVETFIWKHFALGTLCHKLMWGSHWEHIRRHKELKFFFIEYKKIIPYTNNTIQGSTKYNQMEKFFTNYMENT